MGTADGSFSSGCGCRQVTLATHVGDIHAAYCYACTDVHILAVDCHSSLAAVCRQCLIDPRRGIVLGLYGHAVKAEVRICRFGLVVECKVVYACRRNSEVTFVSLPSGNTVNAVLVICIFIVDCMYINGEAVGVVLVRTQQHIHCVGVVACPVGAECECMLPAVELYRW